MFGLKIFLKICWKTNNKLLHLNKSYKMKASYNNENLHHELVLKIKEFIDTMEEFETTPFFYQTEKENQKSFGVLSDNGNSNTMKRFSVLIEDFKPE